MTKDYKKKKDPTDRDKMQSGDANKLRFEYSVVGSVECHLLVQTSYTDPQKDNKMKTNNKKNNLHVKRNNLVILLLTLNTF